MQNRSGQIQDRIPATMKIRMMNFEQPGVKYLNCNQFLMDKIDTLGNTSG